MIQVEITVTQAYDADLFAELNANALSGAGFPIDIIDKEYIAIPSEVVKTGTSIRSKMILIEAD